MTLYFADTFYWIALVNPRDSNHRRIMEFGRSTKPAPILTTDEVLTEFLAYCASSPTLRAESLLLVDDVFNSSNLLIIPQTRESFLSGLELYRARPDKQYSLTDCISMQTMRREGILEVLTNDRHFQQEGFRAIFRDL